jgi:NCS2 family nucleobase:cation symporter-2
VPFVSGVLIAMPHAVIGAVLLFTSCFVFLNGIESMTSRMLDARKILVIGMAVHAGLAVEVFPSFFRSAPIWAQPIVGSALVAGTLVAIALNLLFRIGVRKVATFSVDPQHFSTSAVSDFMQDQGAAWAARRDVVNRATFGAVQLLELLGDTPGPIELEARFDEFNLDLRVRYTGAPLEFPERRPSAREIIASAEGERLLAGHLLRRQRRPHQLPRTGRAGRNSPALRPLITMPVCATDTSLRGLASSEEALIDQGLAAPSPRKRGEVIGC